VRKATTLHDVAELAGVSIATVSKALNGKAHVRAETRLKVERAAAELNFSPNPAARHLLKGRTGTVGLLTNDLEGRFSLPVLMGAEDAFGADSTSVLLCDARGDSIREQHHLKSLLGRRVDGLIVVGDKTDARPSLGPLPIPVVYAYAPSVDDADVSVVSDNVGAGQLAIQHLAQLGRRRIGYVTGDRTYQAARDRAEGALVALQSHSLSMVGGEPLYGSWTEGWGRAAARILLDLDPEIDAISCGSDQIARGVIDALRENGKDVPSQVAVTGHDNWEPIATQSRPPLTTIDINLEVIGRVAAQVLSRAMAGDPERGGVTAIACRLVARGSTIADS